MAEHFLILGATSGMAKAIARGLAQEGHSLTLAGRSAESLETLAGDIALRSNVRPRTLLFDAADFASHETLVADHCRDVSGVVCAVGYLGNQDTAQTDFTEFKTITDANYLGPASILSRLAEQMERNGRGVIIGISSVAGDRGRASNYAYGAAKAGFTAFLSGLRNRLASKGVHVMTVKPGFVDTPMTADMDLPNALTAKPEAVADRVIKAIKRKKDVVYVKPVWRLIMCVIIHIPERLFKRMSL
jgi:short-subunit dehydrogenase